MRLPWPDEVKGRAHQIVPRDAGGAGGGAAGNCVRPVRASAGTTPENRPRGCRAPRPGLAVGSRFIGSWPSPSPTARSPWPLTRELRTWPTPSVWAASRVGISYRTGRRGLGRRSHCFRGQSWRRRATPQCDQRRGNGAERGARSRRGGRAELLEPERRSVNPATPAIGDGHLNPEVSRGIASRARQRDDLPLPELGDRGRTRTRPLAQVETVRRDDDQLQRDPAAPVSPA